MNFLLHKRLYVLIAAHALLIAAAYLLAFQLRFDFDIPEQHVLLMWQSLPWIIVVKLAMFACCGSFHGWWRYVTFSDLAGLLRVSTISTLVIAFVDYFCLPDRQIPRAVLLLDWGATMLVVGGTRSIFRLMREHYWPVLSARGGKPALMVGADQCTMLVVRQIHANPQLDYRVVGYLDDDGEHVGSTLGGIPVLGRTSDAVALAQKHEVQEILVADPNLVGKRLRALMEPCRQAGLQVRVIPQVDHLLNGACRLQVRDVNINDLLRREPVRLDTSAIGAMVRGKRVMVTGAGGSIGSEICRQLLPHQPASLVLVERGENLLFFLERELAGLNSDVKMFPCVADVRDGERMTGVFERFRPELIFHAAAHKHVPLMEHNPSEAIVNNVFGTRHVAELADRFGAERFVLISTDKAVNPTSVMGVSKQLAERVVRALDELSATKYVVVRFGNVLGSNGSVVPIFQEQIRNGGPVTVTHRDMTRFFMTIPEASQLVLQAAAMGDGGEVFVLEMGEQVRIYDLAQDMIRLSGLRPNEDIDIQIVGARPGEKLYEELNLDSEPLQPTAHPKVRVAVPPPVSLSEVHDVLDGLQGLVHGPDPELRRKLCEIVQEYQPTPAERKLVAAQ